MNGSDARCATDHNFALQGVADLRHRWRSACPVDHVRTLIALLPVIQRERLQTNFTAFWDDNLGRNDNDTDDV